MTNAGALLAAIWQTITDPFRKPRDRGMDTENVEMVAICVGHSRSGDKGAVSVGNVSEWEFWQPIAYRIQALLQARGVKAKVFDVYDGGSYGSSMAWLSNHLEECGVTVAVELHFNAASAAANGFEFLHWSRSAAGKRLAGDMLDAHGLVFPDKRSRGVKSKGRGDRGALFLKLTHCPAVICEPFFGTNPGEWGTYAAEQESLALAVSRGLRTYLDK